MVKSPSVPALVFSTSSKNKLFWSGMGRRAGSGGSTSCWPVRLWPWLRQMQVLMLIHINFWKMSFFFWKCGTSETLLQERGSLGCWPELVHLQTGAILFYRKTQWETPFVISIFTQKADFMSKETLTFKKLKNISSILPWRKKFCLPSANLPKNMVIDGNHKRNGGKRGAKKSLSKVEKVI